MGGVAEGEASQMIEPASESPADKDPGHEFELLSTIESEYNKLPPAATTAPAELEPSDTDDIPADWQPALQQMVGVMGFSSTEAISALQAQGGDLRGAISALIGQ